MRTGSLREKLILYFVLLGVAAIAVVGTVAFFSTRDALLKRTFDQLTSLRVAKSLQVEKYYDDRIHDILLLTGESCPLLDLSSPTGQRSLLGNYMGRYFRRFMILQNGRVIASGTLGDRPQEPEGGTATPVPPGLLSSLDSLPVVLSDLVPAESGGTVQFMAARLTRPDGVLSGDCLVMELASEPLTDIMLNNDPGSGLGKSGETYLVGPDLLMRTVSRFQPGSVMRTRVATASADWGREGRTGVTITPDYRGIPVLSAYSPVKIEGLSWFILAEIDESEAMIPVYDTRSRILLLSVLIVLGFFGMVLLISRRISAPLIRLRRAAEDLGKGKYDVSLPVESDDEIGTLTRSFNVMAAQIREKTRELQQERTGRMRSVFDGEEMERQRLSRELHDGIGQSLIAVKLRLENLQFEEGAGRKTSIQELKNYFDQIIDEVRRISNNLMPSVLEVFNIPIAFRNLFNETEEHSALKIHFEAKGNFDDLDKKSKTYIYRLMQEALNNILKHAEARQVWVGLVRSGELLTLSIRDDGKGFRPGVEGMENGNGLHNMYERAGLLKGSLEIRSAPGQGTSIQLTVPNILPDVKNQDFPRG